MWAITGHMDGLSNVMDGDFMLAIMEATRGSKGREWWRK